MYVVRRNDFAYAQLANKKILPMHSQQATDFCACSFNKQPIFVHAQPTNNLFWCMLSIRGNHKPFQNHHSKKKNMLSICGMNFIAG
jgi:hypothetical protein